MAVTDTASRNLSYGAMLDLDDDLLQEEADDDGWDDDGDDELPALVRPPVPRRERGIKDGVLCHRITGALFLPAANFEFAVAAEASWGSAGCGDPGCLGEHTIIGVDSAGVPRVVAGRHNRTRRSRQQDDPWTEIAQRQDSHTKMRGRDRPAFTAGPILRLHNPDPQLVALEGAGQLTATVRRKRRGNGRGSVYRRNHRGYEYWCAAIQKCAGGKRTSQVRFCHSEAEAHAALAELQMELGVED